MQYVDDDRNCASAWKRTLSAAATEASRPSSLSHCLTLESPPSTRQCSFSRLARCDLRIVHRNLDNTQRRGHNILGLLLGRLAISINVYAVDVR